AVTVTNPDLGSGTSNSEGSFLSVTCCAPNTAPVGLAPSRTSGTATLPPAPTVTSLSPNAASIGATITINGTKFSTTKENNFVTFSGPQDSRVLANVTSATARILTVTVPAAAQDG